MTRTTTGTVRAALAERDTTPAKPDLAQVIRQAIEAQASQFRAVLPAGIDSERFARLVLTATKSTPALVECFATPQGRTSVLLAAMQAAAVGLEPNTPLQHCWLTPRRNGGTVEAQLSLGYRGLLALARRSGEIRTVYAEVVREGDEFTWARGLEADVLEHHPTAPDEAPLTHAYAVARFTSGGYAFRVLTRAQVEARRAVADSWRNEKARPYSPWTKWPAEMWRKTALRSLASELPLAADVARALQSEDRPLTFDADAGIVPAELAEPATIDEPSTVSTDAPIDPSES